MNFKRTLKISRPRFWIYELGMYIVGVAAALHTNLSLWTTLPIIIYFIYFLYPANIYIYGVNDIFDYETDRLNPKKVEYESLVMPTEHRILFRHIFFFNLPFIVYAYFIDSHIISILLLGFLFFAGFYSAPPIRAKARPVLDSIFSAGHYVLTALFGYALATHLSGEILNLSFTYGAIVASMSWAMAMHAYSAVPDIKADKEAGLETVATKLGRNNTLYLCAVLYAIAGVISIAYFGFIAAIGSVLYVGLMYKSIKTQSDEELFKLYKHFPLINTLVGMTIFFLTLFAKAL